MIAIVLGWTSIGSVNCKVQSGARQLPMLEQATGHARDMVASEADVGARPERRQDHLGDVQTFRRPCGTLEWLRDDARTPSARSTPLNARSQAWQALDDQVVALAGAQADRKATEPVNGAANDAADKLYHRGPERERAISNANARPPPRRPASSRTLMLVIALIALLDRRRHQLHALP